MEEKTLKVTGTKKKVITEEQKRTLADVKAERKKIHEAIRKHKIALVELRIRRDKLKAVIETIEPPKKEVVNEMAI